jgi:hypothetical protein
MKVCNFVVRHYTDYLFISIDRKWRKYLFYYCLWTLAVEWTNYPFCSAMFHYVVEIWMRLQVSPLPSCEMPPLRRAFDRKGCCEWIPALILCSWCWTPSALTGSRPMDTLPKPHPILMPLPRMRRSSAMRLPRHNGRCQLTRPCLPASILLSITLGNPTPSYPKRFRL